MIRTIRQVLKATLKEQLISDEVLSTFMAEAVNIINSRPLTRNSDSPLDEQPLTPNQLLHLRPCASLPPGIFENVIFTANGLGDNHSIWQTYFGVDGPKSIFLRCWSDRNGI
jgi:hypothetical protein